MNKDEFIKLILVKNARLANKRDAIMKKMTELDLNDIGNHSKFKKYELKLDEIMSEFKSNEMVMRLLS